MADGTLKVGTITTSSGSGTITIGQSGETVTIPSGVTLTNNGTASGFGKVLQVITATDSTARSTTSTSFVTASNTLSVNITPSSTSSKILITASFEAGTNSGARGFWTIYKDSTNLGAANGMFSAFSSAGSLDGSSGSLTFLDSPSSISALTYAVYMKTNGTSCSMNGNTVKGSIVVMEIAG